MAAAIEMGVAGIGAGLRQAQPGVALRNQDAIVAKLQFKHPTARGRVATRAGSCRALGAGGGTLANQGSSGRSASRIDAQQSSTLAESVKAGGANEFEPPPPPDEAAASAVWPAWRQATGNLAARWRDIAGENNWEGLLEPLDPDLKREILKAGDFIWPLYDAMDTDPASKYRGSSLYNPGKLLDAVKLVGTGYKVTKYLYVLSDVDFVNRFAPFFQLPTGTEEGDFWSKDSNWAGYVAVASDEEEIKRLGRRDIIVVFRGTHTAKEWLLNVFDWLWPTQSADDSVPWTDVVKVEAGFWKMYTGKSDETVYNRESLGEQVAAEIRRLIQKHEGEELSISISGHSLGACFAVLAAYDLAHGGANKLPSAADGGAAETDRAESRSQAEKAFNKVRQNVVQTVKTLVPGLTAEKAPIPKGFLRGTVPITAYCFGSPRVGNDDFRDALHALGVKVLRVENPSDIVPKFPGIILNEWHVGLADKWLSLLFDSFPWTYVHVGTVLEVNHKDSPFLLNDPEFMAVHDLDVHLHLVDGYEHEGLRFNPDIHEKHRRDYALVNKYGSMLKEEYRIPQAWFQLENKGMIRDTQGHWRIPDRSEIDKPQSCRGALDPDEQT